MDYRLILIYKDQNPLHQFPGRSFPIPPSP